MPFPEIISFSSEARCYAEVVTAKLYRLKHRSLLRPERKQARGESATADSSIRSRIPKFIEPRASGSSLLDYTSRIKIVHRYLGRYL